MLADALSRRTIVLTEWTLHSMVTRSIFAITDRPHIDLFASHQQPISRNLAQVAQLLFVGPVTRNIAQLRSIADMLRRLRHKMWRKQSYAVAQGFVKSATGSSERDDARCFVRGLQSVGARV